MTAVLESDALPCKICSSEALFIGTKQGKLTQRLFEVFRCTHCDFTFVANPWLEFGAIYSAAYYAGKGADPYVDYVFELERPRETIRQYEWRGIVEAVRSCVPLGPKTRWLDYGCGNGGLVRYCRDHALCAAEGYEEGWIRDQAAKSGIPILTGEALDTLLGTFDIVTAIEVLEHLPDPLSELRRIRSLLKPGGLFFFTTANAEPHRKKLFGWSYFLPEIHVSLFEPKTLARALEKTGFRAEFRGFLPGYENIIRFKMLKTLGFRKVALWESLLPWKPVSRTLDWRLQVTAHPLGWAA